MKKDILAATAEALKQVTHPRFLRSERGYQGKFYCALQSSLENKGILDNRLILEMEYQKSSRHNLWQRPDIVLHVPSEEAGTEVYENNHVVFALKLGADIERAADDFNKLDNMCEKLGYLLAVFININHDTHFIGSYSGKFRERLHGFAVSLHKGTPRIMHAWWQGETICEKEEQ